jgi:hypothetical protein
VTCIDDRPINVTKPELEPDPEDDAADEPVLVAVVALDVADARPPPETDCPTMPSTEATVPPTGARSVVSDSVF